MISLKEYIKSDLARLSPVPTFAAFLRWYFFPQGSTFPHDVWFRIVQKCKTSKILKYTVGIFAYFVERRLSFKYSIHANTNTPIGKGLRIVHGSGVFLNCESIGDNFTVYHNVTLGEGKKNEHTGKSIPTVENNVTVYTGAVVAGGITLHEGCVIAANSFVDKDVPAYTLVAGAPGRIIRKIKEDD